MIILLRNCSCNHAACKSLNQCYLFLVYVQVLRHQLCLCFVAAMILRMQRLKAQAFQPTLTWTCAILALRSPWATSCPILLNVRSSRRRPRPQHPHRQLLLILPLRVPQACTPQRNLRPLRRGRRRWSRSPRTRRRKI